MLFFIIVLLGFALEALLAAPSERLALRAVRLRLDALVPSRFAPIAIILLVILFAAELFIVVRAAHVVTDHVPWAVNLPIALTYVKFPVFSAPQIYGVAFMAVSVVESICVGAFLLASQKQWSRSDTVLTSLGASVIMLLAVAVPAMTSGDLYAYVSDGLLGGVAAYLPPSDRFSGDYAVINHIWRVPLVPAAYGPLWLWFNSIVLGVVSSLYAKLLLLRLVNVMALGVALVALRLLDVARPLIAATVCNPAIAFYYVTNGHNDIVAIAVILVAMMFAMRSPVMAGIVAGIGASVKLTLVIPAAASALVIITLRRRIVYVAAVLITSVLISVVLGGKPYFHALTVVANIYRTFNLATIVRVPHVMVAVAALALTALSVIARRCYCTGSFAFASLAQAFLPWYAIWGLPYAVVRSDVLTAFLIGLPVMTAVLDGEIRARALGRLVIVALLAAIGVALVRRRTLKRTALEV